MQEEKVMLARLDSHGDGEGVRRRCRRGIERLLLAVILLLESVQRAASGKGIGGPCQICILVILNWRLGLVLIRCDMSPVNNVIVHVME